MIGNFTGFVGLGGSKANMVKMTSRFFLDEKGAVRKVASHLSPKMLRFLNRAGAAIRLTGRRKLKPAKRMKLAEARALASRLHSIQRAKQNKRLRQYEQGLAAYRRGRRAELRSVKSGRWQANTFEKPELPFRSADKGKPPLLHAEWDNGTSPLKNRLYYALKSADAAHKRMFVDEVVIGPEIMKAKTSPVLEATGKGMRNLRQLEDEHPFMVPAYETIEPRLPGYLRQATR